MTPSPVTSTRSERPPAPEKRAADLLSSSAHTIFPRIVRVVDAVMLRRLVAFGERYDVREGDWVLTEFGIWLHERLCAVGLLENPIERMNRRARRR